MVTCKKTGGGDVFLFFNRLKRSGVNQEYWMNYLGQFPGIQGDMPILVNKHRFLSWFPVLINFVIGGLTGKVRWKRLDYN